MASHLWSSKLSRWRVLQRDSLDDVARFASLAGVMLDPAFDITLYGRNARIGTNVPP
jgi:hypothetical protein